MAWQNEERERELVGGRLESQVARHGRVGYVQACQRTANSEMRDFMTALRRT